MSRSKSEIYHELRKSGQWNEYKAVRDKMIESLRIGGMGRAKAAAAASDKCSARFFVSDGNISDTVVDTKASPYSPDFPDSPRFRSKGTPTQQEEVEWVADSLGRWATKEPLKICPSRNAWGRFCFAIKNPDLFYRQRDAIISKVKDDHVDKDVVREARTAVKEIEEMIRLICDSAKAAT